jgi:hypothetical protein
MLLTETAEESAAATMRQCRRRRLLRWWRHGVGIIEFFFYLEMGLILRAELVLGVVSVGKTVKEEVSIVRLYS